MIAFFNKIAGGNSKEISSQPPYKELALNAVKGMQY